MYTSSVTHHRYSSMYNSYMLTEKTERKKKPAACDPYRFCATLRPVSCSFFSLILIYIRQANECAASSIYKIIDVHAVRV